VDLLAGSNAAATRPSRWIWAGPARSCLARSDPACLFFFSSENLFNVFIFICEIVKSTKHSLYTQIV
jgi:hypothetical protein